MYTRGQMRTMAIWFLLPFLVLLVIILINPGYGGRIFERLGPVAGMTLLMFWQVVNLIILLVGFYLISRWRARRSADRQRAPRNAAWALSILTFILFVAPSLWLALFYPSILILLQTPDGF